MRGDDREQRVLCGHIAPEGRIPSATRSGPRGRGWTRHWAPCPPSSAASAAAQAGRPSPRDGPSGPSCSRSPIRPEARASSRMVRGPEPGRGGAGPQRPLEGTGPPPRRADCPGALGPGPRPGLGAGAPVGRSLQRGWDTCRGLGRPQELPADDDGPDTPTARRRQPPP